MSDPVAVDSVIVAVPTYQRQAELASLAPLIVEQASTLPYPVRIVAVDNDAARSAEDVAATAGIDYVNEPTPGIGSVRSTALALSSGRDLVVMIDDDVVPTANWLASLVATWAATRATVVVGYVEYRWPEGTPRWIVAGGFMRRNRHLDGASLTAVATGNILVDASAARTLGIDFARDLGLSGGEDTLFGRSVRTAGGEIAASTAAVIDLVPRDRTTAVFVKRRTVAHGEMTTRLQLRGTSGVTGWAARAKALVGGVARLAVFSARELFARLTGSRDSAAVARRRRWFAVGRLKGLSRTRTEEYGR